MVFAVSRFRSTLELTQIHKPLGILALISRRHARLLSALLEAHPKSPCTSRPAVLAAKAAHLALYLLLFLMPLSGWLMVTSTPIRIPVTLFQLFVVPLALAPDLATYNAARTTHLVLSIALALMVVVHTGAAMVHQFLWRDGTLTRMWGLGRSPDPHC